MVFNETHYERKAMYYLKITPQTLDFITEINGGVRPTLRDETGNDQYYIVNVNDEPNEIVSRNDFERMRNLVKNGTRIIFVEGLH
jgi:hypothetical protein